jgi:gluconate 2-dehydrogenase gamma chain
MTTRRQVLQGLIFSLGGAAALTAFQNAEAATDKATGFYSADELALLTFVADGIIPRTDTPGAVGAGVPAYMDHLHLTWASAATQAKHHEQLAAIGTQLDRFGGRNLKALAALDTAAFGQNTHWEYRDVKSLIATVYYLSEPGATEELHYELVPGHWIASAPIGEIGRTWAQ